jgi:hypothetical protein
MVPVKRRPLATDTVIRESASDDASSRKTRESEGPSARAIAPSPTPFITTVHVAIATINNFSIMGVPTCNTVNRQDWRMAVQQSCRDG